MNVRGTRSRMETSGHPQPAASFRERFLEALLESASDYAIIAMDLDGLVTSWNEGARRILGWTEAEMLGRPASLFFTAEDRQRAVPHAEMQAALHHGRGSDERWHEKKGGTRFWANGEMMPLRDETGTVLGFLKILRDRTPQRVAAEKQRADSEFLRSILASSADCIKVLDLDAKLVMMTEGGQRLMEVSDFNQIRGCAWPDFWESDGNARARAAVDAARAGGTGHFQGLAKTMAGTPKWWDVQVTPILDAEGRPEKLLSVSRDITAVKSSEDALREAQSLNTLILNSSRDCIVVLDLDGNTLFVSPGGIESMEISDLQSVLGFSWLRVWSGADNLAARAAVEQARAGNTGRFRGFCPTHAGRPKWWDVMISPLPGADGRPERLVSIGRDITDLKQAEEQQHFLMQELDHRVKNTFAVVQALSWQTFRGDETVTTLRDAFAARLLALSRAHDVLIQGEWTQASLRALVDHTVTVHDQGGTARFEIVGVDVILGAKAALSFALVLHELSTNAVKYGALSTPHGHVAISWRLTDHDSEPYFRFRWEEIGGPPVTPPTRQGFGSRLIERSMTSGLKATVRLSHAPAGVTLTLDAPLASLQES